MRRVARAATARAATARAATASAVATVLVLSLSACGGTEAVQRSIEAGIVGDGAGFVPDTITVDKRNRVELEVGNNTSATHGFSIEGYGIQEEVGSSETLEMMFVAERAGTYKIYCQLHPGHQTATLVVQ